MEANKWYDARGIRSCLTIIDPDGIPFILYTIFNAMCFSFNVQWLNFVFFIVSNMNRTLQCLHLYQY
jgi:hypothetical protein